MAVALQISQRCLVTLKQLHIPIKHLKAPMNVILALSYSTNALLSNMLQNETDDITYDDNSGNKNHLKTSQ